MEKRNWLWKRKSSDKSPCGTESSCSTNSHTESDDREAFKTSPCHTTQSPEVTSNPASSTEDSNDDNMKRLAEKLSAALVNVNVKDDLVKQHTIVAEEAVAGWEMAENEMAFLKQQLETAVKQKSALEDQVSHLDGALKECVRQLRQARDEREQKIYEAVVEKTREWESAKFELENQLKELKSKLEEDEYQSPAHLDPEIYNRVEALEKENLTLRLELLLQIEQLKISNLERDLSTQAAETASKQHLESIKKVSKLEAECRRLQSMGCKSSTINDCRSSIHVGSLLDSQSDGGENLSSSCFDSQASAFISETNNRNVTTSSIQIDLLDDFLEMERLAALPETHSTSHSLESEAIVNQAIDPESSLRSELEDMTRRIAESEEKLWMTEAEKIELEMNLSRSQDCIKASQFKLREAELKLEEMQKELHEAYKSKSSTEDQYIYTEAKNREMTANIESLQADVKKERELSINFAAKCRDLKEELSENINEAKLQQTALSNYKLIKQDAELKVEELQKELHTAYDSKSYIEIKLIDMELETQEMTAKIESLEADIKKERESSIKLEVKCCKLEEELSQKINEVELQQTAISNCQFKIKQEAELKFEELHLELHMAYKSKSSFEAQLVEMEMENRKMTSRIESLEADVQKERELSTILATKCHELEDELSKKIHVGDLQQNALSNCELKIKQEAELKFEELQQELRMAYESKSSIEAQLELETGEMAVKIESLEEDTKKERELSTNLAVKCHEMTSKIESLEADVQKERKLCTILAAKCHELEDELSKKIHEIDLQQNAISNCELKIKHEAQLKFDELQQELHLAYESKSSIEAQLKLETGEMAVKIESLEEDTKKEIELSTNLAVKCRELEEELSKKINEVELQQLVISNCELKIKQEAELKLEVIQKELHTAYESKSSIQAQYIDMEAETREMTAKIKSLEADIRRERELSTKLAVKCRALKEELSKKIHEVELQHTAISDCELKIKQEDLNVAAGRLAECQKTIASLGNQLKSLAVLDDFLIDTVGIQEVSNVGEEWKLHSNETFSPKRNSNSSRIARESYVPSNAKISPPSSSSSSAVSSNHTSSERSRNGFAKFFSRSKMGINLEI